MKPGTWYAIEREVAEAEIEAMEEQREAEELAQAIERDMEGRALRMMSEEAEYWWRVEQEFAESRFDDFDMIDDGRLDYLIGEG